MLVQLCFVSDLFENHIVGFLMMRLKCGIPRLKRDVANYAKVLVQMYTGIYGIAVIRSVCVAFMVRITV